MAPHCDPRQCRERPVMADLALRQRHGVCSAPAFLTNHNHNERDFAMSEKQPKKKPRKRRRSPGRRQYTQITVPVDLGVLEKVEQLSAMLEAEYGLYRVPRYEAIILAVDESLEKRRTETF